MNLEKTLRSLVKAAKRLSPLQCMKKRPNYSDVVPMEHGPKNFFQDLEHETDLYRRKLVSSYRWGYLMRMQFQDPRFRHVPRSKPIVANAFLGDMSYDLEVLFQEESLGLADLFDETVYYGPRTITEELRYESQRSKNSGRYRYLQSLVAKIVRPNGKFRALKFVPKEVPDVDRFGLPNLDEDDEEDTLGLESLLDDNVYFGPMTIPEALEEEERLHPNSRRYKFLCQLFIHCVKLDGRLRPYRSMKKKQLAVDIDEYFLDRLLLEMEPAIQLPIILTPSMPLMFHSLSAEILAF